jgi:ATP-binding cassette subfamily B (MDR/TAP) protein 1
MTWLADTFGRQVRELQMATSQPMGFFVKDVAAAVMAIGIAFYYSWRLTLVLSLSVPTASLVLWLVSRRLQPAIEAQRRELNIASKYTNTAFHAIDTVKVFNGQNHEIRQYASAINAAGLSYMIQGQVRASQMGSARFLVVVMFMAGFWYGLKLYKDGELTPGDVITTFYSFLMGNQAVTSLLAQYVILCKGKSAGATLERIVGELNNTLPLSKIAGTRTLEVCDGDIEVTNASNKLVPYCSVANYNSSHSHIHRTRRSPRLSALTYSSLLEKRHFCLVEVDLAKAR